MISHFALITEFVAPDAKYPDNTENQKKKTCSFSLCSARCLTSIYILKQVICTFVVGERGLGGASFFSRSSSQIHLDTRPVLVSGLSYSNEACKTEMVAPFSNLQEIRLEVLFKQLTS